MDSSNTNPSNGSIESSKFQKDGDPPFRIPPVPTSPSSTPMAMPVETHSGLVQKHSSLLGNSNGKQQFYVIIM